MGADVEDLAAWLTQIWDEDQAVALGAEGHSVFDGTGVVADRHARGTVVVRSPVARHIARHDPAAALARIAADRQILAACQRVYRAKDREYGDGSHDLADEILDLLATPYADRPGYREEWKP